jgi:predicted DNA-binding transcriptional regulator AlpA
MPSLKQATGEAQSQLYEVPPARHAERKPPARALDHDPLLTAEEVAARLHVSTDWVWDHSSRKKPFLPVIRMGDGALRYRHSGIEAFIDERERLSALRHRAG